MRFRPHYDSAAAHVTLNTAAAWGGGRLQDGWSRWHGGMWSLKAKFQKLLVFKVFLKRLHLNWNPLLQTVRSQGAKAMTVCVKKTQSCGTAPRCERPGSTLLAGQTGSSESADPRSRSDPTQPAVALRVSPAHRMLPRRSPLSAGRIRRWGLVLGPFLPVSWSCRARGLSLTPASWPAGLAPLQHSPGVQRSGRGPGTRRFLPRLRPSWPVSWSRFCSSLQGGNGRGSTPMLGPGAWHTATAL